MGGGGEATAPHFLHIYYGPSVACTVGCTWLMYSLCMAHIWPMYYLYMAYIICISIAARSERRGIRPASLRRRREVLPGGLEK